MNWRVAGFFISAVLLLYYFVWLVSRRRSAQPEIPAPECDHWSWKQLILASFLTLFAELALIRWIGTEVRIFAYVKNLALLLCFLGFGVGCALARRPSLARFRNRSARVADGRAPALARQTDIRKPLRVFGCSAGHSDLGIRHGQELAQFSAGSFDGCRLAPVDGLHFYTARTGRQPAVRVGDPTAARIFVEPGRKLVGDSGIFRGFHGCAPGPAVWMAVFSWGWVCCRLVYVARWCSLAWLFLRPSCCTMFHPRVSPLGLPTRRSTLKD